MNNPSVTVVIPLYNHERYIQSAIESALAQTYRAHELVVVDDGSTDRSPSLAKSFGPAIKYIRKENAGCASAFNVGVREARGQWIAWLSSDDRWLPRKLELQISALARSGSPVLSYSDDYLIDSSGRRISRRYMPSYKSTFARRVNLIRRCFISGSSVVVSKTALEEAGLFDEGDRYTHDYRCWLRLASRGDWIHVPEPLVESRVHSGQMSANVEAMERSAHAVAFSYAREYGSLAGAAGSAMRIADSIALIPLRAARNSHTPSQGPHRIDPLALLPWQRQEDPVRAEMRRQLDCLLRDFILLVNPYRAQPIELRTSPVRR